MDRTDYNDLFGAVFRWLMVYTREPEYTEKFFIQAYDELAEIVEKFGNTKLACNMADAAYKELDQIARRQK